MDLPHEIKNFNSNKVYDSRHLGCLKRLPRQNREELAFGSHGPEDPVRVYIFKANVCSQGFLALMVIGASKSKTGSHPWLGFPSIALGIYTDLLNSAHIFLKYTPQIKADLIALRLGTDFHPSHLNMDVNLSNWERISIHYIWGRISIHYICRRIFYSSHLGTAFHIYHWVYVFSYRIREGFPSITLMDSHASEVATLTLWRRKVAIIFDNPYLGR